MDLDRYDVMASRVAIAVIQKAGVAAAVVEVVVVMVVFRRS